MNSNELRLRRLALGWSREQLAANLGVPERMVAGWENNRIPTESLSRLDRLFRGYEAAGPPMLPIKKQRPSFD